MLIEEKIMMKECYLL